MAPKLTFKFLAALGAGAISSDAFQERNHGIHSSSKCIATSRSAWINVREMAAYRPVQRFQPEIHGVGPGFRRLQLRYWQQSHDQLPVELGHVSSCDSMAVALLFGI